MIWQNRHDTLRRIDLSGSGLSGDVQLAVLNKYPEAVFWAVETTGDRAVNFPNCVQMYLFKARRRARDEFERALQQTGSVNDLAS